MNRHIALTSPRRTQGLTLIELMIALVILGILTAIAYPSYSEYVRKGKRSVAKSALLDAANRQEQFFFNNRAYTTTMSGAGSLGFASSPAYFGSDGASLSGSSGAIYQVDAIINTAACGGAPCFKLTATPLNEQAGDSCGNFSLNSANMRTPATGCW